MSSLNIWANACVRHRLWFFLCIFFLITAEVWLWLYPPKGYEAKDILALGEACGEALVDFPKVWERIIHDDEFMLEIMAESCPISALSNEDKLLLLEDFVRNGLSYKMLNPFMAEITFRSMFREKIRPFLTIFTARLLDHIKSLSAHEYRKRFFTATAVYEILVRRRHVLQELFMVYDWPSLLEPTLETFENLNKSSASSSFQLLGRLAVDSVVFQEIKAKQDLTALTTNNAFVQIFASMPILLTNHFSPPKLVMPAVKMLSLLMPLGFFCIYIAGIILLESAPLLPNNDDAIEKA